MEGDDSMETIADEEGGPGTPNSRSKKGRGGSSKKTVAPLKIKINKRKKKKKGGSSVSFQCGFEQITILL